MEVNQKKSCINDSDSVSENTFSESSFDSDFCEDSYSSNVNTFLDYDLLISDNYQCQYCLSKKAPLTIDHIVPKNKGGEDSWTNLVIACQNCNRKKGNKTLKQSNMDLNKKPRKPNKIQYFQKFIKSEQNSWKPYLFMESM